MSGEDSAGSLSTHFCTTFLRFNNWLSYSPRDTLGVKAEAYRDLVDHENKLSLIAIALALLAYPPPQFRRTCLSALNYARKEVKCESVPRSGCVWVVGKIDLC